MGIQEQVNKYKKELERLREEYRNNPTKTLEIRGRLLRKAYDIAEKRMKERMGLPEEPDLLTIFDATEVKND